MPIQNMAILVLVLPLFSSIANGFFPSKVKGWVGFMACCSMLLTTFTALGIFYYTYDNIERVEIKIRNWFILDNLEIYWSLIIDRFTSIIILIVSIISTVVHFYSLEYMHDDPKLNKYFSYLSLFTFFMFMLVGAGNFIQLFLGWEGVGLCSYLLIGFWNYKDSANYAANKAFIVNRVGDFFFILGIVIIYYYTKQLEFAKIFQSLHLIFDKSIGVFGTQIPALDIICLLLFLGCMGKSAQIGLHTWLPDAMEGPTPVSALIHAATMVTAGVFLVAKCSFLFEYSPPVLNFIAIIGGITSIFAASIAIAQTDIKKIIAYSTCSQLGYMFLACGVSAYRAAIFHMITHAFFKALMFLLAGNVIHAVHEQDITKLGGLKKKLPLTYLNFLIASLALIGIYPLAGFYSKDIILEAVYKASSLDKVIYLFGLTAVLFTAFYCVKIVILTFYGKTKLQNTIYENAKEAPNIMNIPLSILAMGSLFSGMIGYYILRIGKFGGYFLDTIFRLNIPGVIKISLIIKLLPMIVGVIGIILASLYYLTPILNPLKMIFARLHSILFNGYYFNELYNNVFVRSTYKLGNIFNFTDKKVIDKMGPNTSINIASKIGDATRLIQTGYVHNYIALILLGIVVIMTYFIINNINLI